MNRLSVRGKGEKISSKREPFHRLNRKQKIAQGVTFAVHKLSYRLEVRDGKDQGGDFFSTFQPFISKKSAKNNPITV